MRRLLCALPLLVIVASCAAADQGVVATRSHRTTGGILSGDTGEPSDPADPADPSDSTVLREYPVIDGVVDFGERGPVHPEYDGYLTAAFQDVEEFWSQAYPEAYGTPWEPLAGGIYAGYPEREAPIPACSRRGGNASYEEIQQGTAYYCPLGDYIAYDDHDRLPALVDSLGREAVAVALAHEFGHAVQFRAGEFDQPVILMEQQADCFAGAWVAHAASGGSDLIIFDDAGIRSGLVAMLSIADPIQTDGSNPLANANAHGTGFDRVGAFQDGFLGGVTRCETFFTEGRINQLIDLPFVPNDPNAGNLPLFDPTGNGVDIVTLIPQGLDQFWTELMLSAGIEFTPPSFEPFPQAGPFPECDGITTSRWPRNVLYCAADNTIYWDQDYAELLTSPGGFGDMSVGYLFANAYSDAVQTALGSSLAGEGRVLLAGCLTGAWTAWTIPTDGDQDITLSAGDLDEAVITAIVRSDATADIDVNGSAFEAVDAFRNGVLGGVDACRARLA